MTAQPSWSQTRSENRPGGSAAGRYRFNRPVLICDLPIGWMRRVGHRLANVRLWFIRRARAASVAPRVGRRFGNINATGRAAWSLTADQQVSAFVRATVMMYSPLIDILAETVLVAGHPVVHAQVVHVHDRKMCGRRPIWR